MKHILLITTTIFTLIFSAGCSITPKYRVTIDAIKAKNITIAPSSYTIKALNDSKNIESLRFQQQLEPLIKMLNESGYQKREAGELAQQSIYFDYGLEKVQEGTESHTEPNISFNVGWGFPYGGYYGHHYHPFWNDFYGTGYTSYNRSYIYYNRYITLLAKDQFSKELWRVDVSSIGESKDLRKIIPLLIEAAKPYIGTTTDEPIQLVIKDESEKKR